MKYFILYSDDGVSAEGFDFVPHDTLEEAIEVAADLVESDESRTADDFFIRADDGSGTDITDYDIRGNEI